MCAERADPQQVGGGYKRDLWLMLCFGEGEPGSADVSTHLQSCCAIPGGPVPWEINVFRKSGLSLLFQHGLTA